MNKVKIFTSIGNDYFYNYSIILTFILSLNYWFTYEYIMNTATISSKFQLVIPKEIRELMNIKPGQKVKLIPYNNTIEIIPIVDMKSLFGIFKGMDTTIEREEEDRI